jgi:hypothetical protein
MRIIITAIVIVSVFFSCKDQGITHSVQAQVKEEVGEAMSDDPISNQLKNTVFLDTFGVVNMRLAPSPEKESRSDCEFMETALRLVAVLHKKVFHKYSCIKAMAIRAPLTDDQKVETGKEFVALYKFLSPSQIEYACEGTTKIFEFPEDE